MTTTTTQLLESTATRKLASDYRRHLGQISLQLTRCALDS